MHLLGHTIRIYEGHTTIFLHRNRGVTAVHFSGKLAHFPRRSYSHLLNKIWAAVFGKNFKGIRTTRRA
jgi:hypothetical protein